MHRQSAAYSRKVDRAGTGLSGELRSSRAALPCRLRRPARAGAVRRQSQTRESPASLELSRGDAGVVSSSASVADPPATPGTASSSPKAAVCGSRACVVARYARERPDVLRAALARSIESRVTRLVERCTRRHHHRTLPSASWAEPQSSSTPSRSITATYRTTSSASCKTSSSPSSAERSDCKQEP